MFGLGKHRAGVLVATLDAVRLISLAACGGGLESGSWIYDLGRVQNRVF